MCGCEELDYRCVASIGCGRGGDVMRCGAVTFQTRVVAGDQKLRLVVVPIEHPSTFTWRG
jgi:hypothetical protein